MRIRYVNDGFTLVEVLVAIAITTIVVAAAFGALSVMQDTHRRESEMAAMKQNTRHGLERMNGDLLMAGYKAPATLAALWDDGPGGAPDEVTIVYADARSPTSLPDREGGTFAVGVSLTLYIDSETLDPGLADSADAYKSGTVLLAIETDDCNQNDLVGFQPLLLTQDARCTGGGEPGGDQPGCATIRLDYSPFHFTDMSLPEGFDYDVVTDCAIVGRYHFVQYRIDNTHPEHPVLERRDLGTGQPWVPVSNNIEDLQVRYTVGSSGAVMDTLLVPPDPENKETWISSVRTVLTGRSDSPRFRGARSSELSRDPYNRWTIAATVAVRNRLSGRDLRLFF